jgi:hypothetical protein
MQKVIKKSSAAAFQQENNPQLQDIKKTFAAALQREQLGTELCSQLHASKHVTGDANIAKRNKSSKS